MRKQNSTFKTAFLSEAGSELENNDYFAFVELDRYACYVIADGLNDLPDAESARLATQTVILAFQDRPSMKKRAILSYLETANKVLAAADSREKLKASVTVVVTDYTEIRYGHVGNTRLRLYRDGLVKEQTQDMSLGTDLVKERNLSEDILSKHEQRNNLYTYLGQGQDFEPVISKRIKLTEGDIITLYTRGIWENLDGGELDDVFSEAKDTPQESLDNVEDLLLSRQPGELENYTLAVIFVDKVFLDPNRKRRIKKVITVSIIILAAAAISAILLWAFQRKRIKDIQNMNQKYTNTVEYLQDNNYVRAAEECKAALTAAEKLWDRKLISELSDYQKLIEAINVADDAYSSGKYEQAQSAYVTAKERSRYSNHIADPYIDKQLQLITDYRSVFDYLQLGDTLAAQGDFDRAEEKYLLAKSLATKIYFEGGRKEAMEALGKMYADRDEAEAEVNQEAKERAISATGATQLASDGDKAFMEGDYEDARAYYAMALEKYQQLGDTAHADLIKTKIDSSNQKSEENKQKKQQAEAYVAEGREQESVGDRLGAKKQYLFARNIYKELKLDDKVIEVDGLLELLETTIEQEKEEQERRDSEQAENESESGYSERWATSEEVEVESKVRGEGGSEEVGPGV